MTSQDILDALEYLQSNGMSNAQLERLHHKKSPESFGAAFDYWRRNVDKGVEPSPQSVEYGQRLRYVMDQHRSGKRDYAELISEAWSRCANK